MNVDELLKCDSMSGARLIVKGKQFDALITGINILEAPDIDLWGRQGMVLLSSYFALRPLSPAELEAFFVILDEIGISALVIKLQRLIDEIPPQIVELCQQHDLTLIQIGRGADYQAILLDVFRPVVERAEKQLALHYKLSNISSRLSLSNADTLEILQRFKQFLNLDLTLTASEGERTVSTEPGRLSAFTMGSYVPVRRNEYMNFTYRRFQCSYDGDDNTPDTALVIDISCVEDRRHTLVVHEMRDHRVQDNEVVIIENLIRSLQTVILRNLAARQQQQMNRNALVGDLLMGKLTQQHMREEALAALGLNLDSRIRVLTMYLNLTSGDETIMMAPATNALNQLLRGMFPRSLFRNSPTQIQFVLQETDTRQYPRLEPAITRAVNQMLKREGWDDTVAVVGGLSGLNPARMVQELEVESRSTAQFLQRNNKWGTIGSFDSLGAIKLFILSDQPDLQSFVPGYLMDLYTNDRPLYDTLRLYIQCNLSHKGAAEQLGVHPKTVSYRIARLEDEHGINAQDAQMRSILLMAFEILSFTEENVPDHAVPQHAV